MWTVKKKHKLVIGFIVLVWLITPWRVTAQDFTQGYLADKAILRGSIVALSDMDVSKVEAIDESREKDILGVVVSAAEAPLTLTDSEYEAEVFVATGGRYEVLVTDLNGPIKPGDALTISSITGIAMLADAEHTTLVGTALSSFNISDKDTPILRSITVNDHRGSEVVVSIGRVPIEINIRPNPNVRIVSGLPPFLARAAEALSGQSGVSALRVYISMLVLLMVGAISGSLLYGAVKNSFVSIGRNPLSKHSVMSGLIQVIIVSSVIFVSGLVGVYFILRI